ncbi:MAG TPA: ATP-binding protein [Petrimonas sp.]|jgi:hypothetical protein|nr:ATP-binding protein [Petrimonas sp.]
MTNPFLIKGYLSKEFFCNRVEELKELERNVKNGIDTTLISARRLGKTGLIMRLFEGLKGEPFELIYVDIYASRTQSDFIKLLIEAILKKIPPKTTIGKNFFSLLKSLRPVISYDPISGEPQITISYQTAVEKEYTLQGILDFLEQHPQKIVLAIDEFQQITEYPEKNTESILRTYMQHLQNIRFIFCGSDKRMMTDIFSNVKHPFFASTQFLNLGKINRDQYAVFIKDSFARNGKHITDEAVDLILDWSKTYTFYTQSVCNMTFSISGKNSDIETVKKACIALLKQGETVYLQYRKLLTPGQWNYLIAVAKEDVVRKITAQSFITRYDIGTPANSRRLLKALLEKELLLEIQETHAVSYQVYDVFFSRWLQMEY